MGKPLDPVTAYATKVVAGEVVAGRLVRLQCQRHLNDLSQQRARGLAWKPDEAQKAIDFFAEVLCLPEETAAGEVVVDDVDAEPEDGTPFVLSPWQQFVVGSLIGWYTVKGFRRFRTCYLETAKGSGKTPLCAGIMIYIMVVDGERGAQLYFAAVSKEQAGYAFADADKMVQASPALRALLDRKVNNIAWLEKGSFMRAISAEKRGLDGKRVSAAVIDELHEAKPVVVNKMRKGTKGRRNALIIEPTNAGYDRTSVCWHHHEYSQKVLEETVDDDAWFAFVCGLDPCEECLSKGKLFPADDCPNCDDWRTEGPHWLKPNPNLGVSLSWQYVRELVRQAKGMASEVNDLLRFNFGIWTQAYDRYIDMGAFHASACKRTVSVEELVGAPCYAGLDLGETDDLSAFVVLWALEDGRIVVKLRAWLPEAAIEARPDRPYAVWFKSGILEKTEGDQTDFSVVQAAVEADCHLHGVKECAYDKRFAAQMAQNLLGSGITMVDTPQGWQLNEAVKRSAMLVSAGNLLHGNNPLLAWAASNVVVRHGPNKTVRLDKEQATEKIDPWSALVMALSRWIVQAPDEDAEASKDFEERGLFL